LEFRDKNLIIRLINTPKWTSIKHIHEKLFLEIVQSKNQRILGVFEGDFRKVIEGAMLLILYGRIDIPHSYLYLWFDCVKFTLTAAYRTEHKIELEFIETVLGI
jgi:hypothetical protein